MIWYPFLATKGKAVEKLLAMKGQAVFAGKKLDDKIIDGVYAELNDTDPRFFLKNLLNLQQFWTKKTIRRLVKKPQFEDVNDQAFDTSLVREYNHS